MFTPVSNHRFPPYTLLYNSLFLRNFAPTSRDGGGPRLPPLYLELSFSSLMLDKSIITDIVSSAIADTDIFIVEISVSPANDVVVLLDSDGAAIDIDTCAAITRAIEDAFNRDIEDFSLEVGSAGITSPLKVHRQYLKNIGHDVEVLTLDGRKIHGVLTAVASDGSFTVESPVKVKEPGAKRPAIVMQPTTLRPDECKSVRPEISFK